MNKLFPILLLMIASLAYHASLAATIYSDNFDGATGSNLHGTSSDVGAATWTAHTAFKADGLVTTVVNGSGAFLPFTPAAGQIYTLDASLRGVAATTNNANWFALGFTEGVPAAPVATGNSVRFLGDPSTGKAWMLFRGSNSTNPNQTFRGDDASGTFAGGAENWVAGPTNGGDVDLRITLDSTGGPGTYKASFFAKRPSDAAYTQVSSGVLPLNHEVIGGVGVAFSSNNLAGRLTHFSLTAIPEPSSFAIAAFAGAAVPGAHRRAPKRTA